MNDNKELKELMEKLGNEIEKYVNKWYEYRHLIGRDSYSTMMLNEIHGMEKAFEIVFGISEADWLCAEE